MFSIPFSTSDFLQVLADYNQAIWPTQVVAYLLGGVAIAAAYWTTRYVDKIVPTVLAVFWLFTGIGYHLTFFTRINTPAYAFGTLYIIQAVLFLAVGLRNEGFRFSFRRDNYGIVGGLLMLYALVIYPLFGVAIGHAYPQMPVFGVTPCPVTIFTFGMLLWTVKKVPVWVLIIPSIWALIGFTASIAFNMYEDVVLLLSAVVGVGMLLYRNRKERPVADQAKPMMPA